MSIRLISCVPAPTVYNRASRRNLPVGYSEKPSKTRPSNEDELPRTVDIPVPTKALHSLQRDLNRLLRRIQDGTCTISAAYVSAITGTADGIDQRPRGGEFRVHVGDLPLHELECSDGLTELATLMNVVEGIIKGGLHDSKRTTTQHQTLEVQPRHEDPCAFVNWS